MGTSTRYHLVERMPVTAGVLYRKVLSLNQAEVLFHCRNGTSQTQRVILMPRLADGFVGELKDRIDLYDIVSRYVQLKKSGSSWVGLSPFNKENSIFLVYIHRKAFLIALCWVKKRRYHIYPKDRKPRFLRSG